nr:retrotransposon protein, putative, unclassified [Tanacetum cinerariifolium]GFA17499.1 retrotransposon protein, putative, unclassified [Tanacetum cinerariifolium]
MDVKSAFLYGTINEEVYVMQPHGFQDPEFPAKVYKVEKEMYGLHQALRAWQAVQVWSFSKHLVDALATKQECAGLLKAVLFGHATLIFDVTGLMG